MAMIGSISRMSVGTSQALRVLAHELRSPAGVAQGYVRMLLDGRLGSPDEQRHALEQVREVIGRIGTLSRQASDAASWLDRAKEASPHPVPPRAVVESALDVIGSAPDVTATVDLDGEEGEIAAVDREALSSSMASVLGAVIRERLGRPTLIRAHVTGNPRMLEVLAGSEEALASLPSAADEGRGTTLTLERGGLGLTLVNAAFVLDAHRATLWTVDDRRDACGIRIPLGTVNE